jgi:hypothetical protein
LGAPARLSDVSDFLPVQNFGAGAENLRPLVFFVGPPQEDAE